MRMTQRINTLTDHGKCWAGSQFLSRSWSFRILWSRCVKNFVWTLPFRQRYWSDSFAFADDPAKGFS